MIFERISEENCFDFGIVGIYPEFDEYLFDIAMGIKLNFAIQYTKYFTIDVTNENTKDTWRSIDVVDYVMEKTHETVMAIVISWNGDKPQFEVINLDDINYTLSNSADKLKQLELMIKI